MGIELGARFGGREAAAECDRRTDHVEEVVGDEKRNQRGRLLAVAPVHALLELIAGDAADRVAPIEVLPAAVRHVTAIAGADHHELLGSRRTRHREQHRVGEREDGQVGADAEGNGRDGRGEQTRLAHERADRIADVADEVFDAAARAWYRGTALRPTPRSRMPASASARASAGDRPRAMLASISSCRWARSSRERSCSTRVDRNRDRRRSFSLSNCRVIFTPP